MQSHPGTVLIGNLRAELILGAEVIEPSSSTYIYSCLGSGPVDILRAVCIVPTYLPQNLQPRLSNRGLCTRLPGGSQV